MRTLSPTASLRTTDPTPTILKRYRYAYDPAGNRTVEQIDDAPVLASYDEMNRLQQHMPGGEIRFAGSLSEPAAVTIQSTPARVTSDNRFELGVPVTSGTNQVEIQARDVAGNARTNTYDVGVSGSSKTFTFDPNGNMTGDGTRTFELDAENRLIAINQGTLRSEFYHDGENRRVRIVEETSGNVDDDTRFVWCGFQICEQRDADGTTVERRFYDRGMMDIGVDLFYSEDHAGSLRELTASNNAVRMRYEFDPFGRSSKVFGSSDAVFTFTGYFFHQASGVLLSPYRGYSPDIGRWMSPDPAGRVDGPNLYQYVLNNPVTFSDPSGLAVITPSCTGVYRRRAEEAARQVYEAIDGGCLPCDQDPNKWRDQFDRTFIHCDFTEVACGFAGTGDVPSPTDITIYGVGFNVPEKCGCPTSIMLHELAHNVTGYGGHDLANPNSPDILASLCSPCEFKVSEDAR